MWSEHNKLQGVNTGLSTSIQAMVKIKLDLNRDNELLRNQNEKLALTICNQKKEKAATEGLLNSVRREEEKYKNKYTETQEELNRLKVGYGQTLNKLNAQITQLRAETKSDKYKKMIDDAHKNNKIQMELLAQEKELQLAEMRQTVDELKYKITELNHQIRTTQ